MSDLAHIEETPQTPAPQAGVSDSEIDVSGAQPEASADEPETVETEQREAAEAEARKQGWAPKEEWKGDPSKWVDAQEFVRRGDPRYLREQLATVEQRTAEMLDGIKRANKAERERAVREEQQKHQAQLASLDTEYRAALRQHAGDPNAIARINTNYNLAVNQVEANREDPVITASAGAAKDAWPQNTAFESDPVFKAAAAAEMTKLSEEFPITRETADAVQAKRFAELDKRLSARFPEHYGQTGEQPNNGAPPANSRSMDGVRVSADRQASAFSKLPKEAQEFARQLKADGDIKSLEDYAKEYLKDD